MKNDEVVLRLTRTMFRRAVVIWFVSLVLAAYGGCLIGFVACNAMGVAQ